MTNPGDTITRRAAAESRPADSVQRVVGAHAGDCTIYAALINGTPLDGICTCGYGWECVRLSDWSKMFSAEWLEANVRPNDQAQARPEQPKL